ncbi:hypothetical protein VPH35_043030 [Triticum aestivum]
MGDKLHRREGNNPDHRRRFFDDVNFTSFVGVGGFCILHHLLNLLLAIFPTKYITVRRSKRRKSAPAIKKHTKSEDVPRMKHIFKIITVLAAISAVWAALLETSTVPHSYTWLLPIYLVVALGCYGLFMVGYGLMFFPTCPQEAILLQQDIMEAKEFLSKRGVDLEKV